MAYDFERNLEAKLSRRDKADDRYLAKIERKSQIADTMIGMLMRDGKEVYYIFPVGGKYREGTETELWSYLVHKWL